ncbi:MAG: two-component regulator propeller domain-containing protein [Bacteroidota bacterium]
MRKASLISSLFVVFLLVHQPTVAQLDKRIGEWTSYLSQSDIVRSVEKDGLVYSITSGGMFSFDPANNETRLFSTVDQMSGIDPTTVHVDPTQNLLFIGYNDGMIDFFDSPDNFQFFTDIERNTFYTRKRINDFASTGSRLYVATDFGMVVYDLNQRLPEATITQIAENPSRLIIRSVTVYQERIWIVLQNNRLYSAPENFPNLADPVIWREENGLNGLSAFANIQEIGSNANTLYARTDSTLFEFRNGQWSLLTDNRFQQKFDHITIQEGVITATIINNTRTLYQNGQFRELFVEGGVNHVLVVGQDIYVGKEDVGLDRFSNGDLTNITPEGPRNNSATGLAAGNGELYIAPRGFQGAFSPAVFFDGVYHFTRETGWTLANNGNGGLPNDRANTSYARAYYDPFTQTAWLGSFGRGLASFQGGVLQNFYDCENSSISTIDGVCELSSFGNTRVSGIDVDAFGNVWVSLSLALQPLMALTPEGEWIGIDKNRFPSSLNAINMIADEAGSKWLLSRRNGIEVYNDNGTLDAPNDDILVSLRAGGGQGNLPSNDVTAIAEDSDGAVWVGTSAGVTVFFDPFSIGQGFIVDASAPIFNGRPLLENEIVNAIAVDGGNRKWFATNSGAFLISEDGTEQIQHFTESNSPLLSDGVNDISIDGNTGEVYFATDKGVISYRGDATEGVQGCDDIYVFPNPVFTDFAGGITIQGTTQNATVKIVTVSGSLVREVRAQGGTAIWDGRDIRGEKVHSGIYLALSADQDGENGCIAKFSVVRR